MAHWLCPFTHEEDVFNGFILLQADRAQFLFKRFSLVAKQFRHALRPKKLHLRACFLTPNGFPQQRLRLKERKMGRI